jgi:hypothetical protein
VCFIVSSIGFIEAVQDNMHMDCRSGKDYDFRQADKPAAGWLRNSYWRVEQNCVILRCERSEPRRMATCT